MATDFDDLGNIGVKIVGRPRIRQVRLGEKTLISPEFQVLNLTTFHPYSIEVSENRDFRENWIHSVDDDNQVDNNTTKFEPWQFKAERGGIQYRGEMVSKYPYGGYYSAFKFVVRLRNLVIFGDFQNDFRPKIEIFKMTKFR